MAADKESDRGEDMTTRLVLPQPAAHKSYVLLGVSCTKQDCLIILLTSLIRFGDGIEFYLPGVITQKVSCELRVSSTQEGILGITLYVSLALSGLLSIPIARCLGNKRTLILSLYTSILFAVFCAVVANYYTLLLSRTLIGLCVGLNVATEGVYRLECVSTGAVNTLGISAAMFSAAAGCGWVSLMSFFFLDMIGWRIFVLIVSLPVFIPSVILLHCCTGGDIEALPEESEDYVSENSQVNSSQERCPDYWTNVIHMSMLCFINLLQGWGGILLLPALLRQINKEMSHQERSLDPCADTVDGIQFLILAFVSGFGNILGRVAGFWLSGRGNVRLIQGSLATAMTGAYIALIFDTSLVTVTISMSFTKFIFGMMMMQQILSIFDGTLFGKTDVALVSAIILSAAAFGAVAGNSFAAFLDPITAVWCTISFSVVQIGLSCRYSIVP